MEMLFLRVLQKRLMNVVYHLLLHREHMKNYI